jgi:uncharacterized protein YegP (UPF0339 family)
MATKQHTIRMYRMGGQWHWIRKANNGTLIGRSHKGFTTPGLAKKNIAETQLGPYAIETVTA